MAWRLQLLAGSIAFSGAHTYNRTCRINYFSHSAVHVPLRRPASPQPAKFVITREQLLSSMATHTSGPTPPSQNESSWETVELAVLIDVLPARVRTALRRHTALPQLVEVVLDLGRPVVARFSARAETLSQAPLTQAELEEVTSKARVGPTKKQHRHKQLRAFLSLYLLRI